jgi:hypothetical protein
MPSLIFSLNVYPQKTALKASCYVIRDGISQIPGFGFAVIPFPVVLHRFFEICWSKNRCINKNRIALRVVEGIIIGIP